MTSTVIALDFEMHYQTVTRVRVTMNYLIFQGRPFKERRVRSDWLSSGESRVFQVRPPGPSSAVWTCPWRHDVARKDTQRVTVCTSALVFLSEWRWLIKIGALSSAYPGAHVPSSLHIRINCAPTTRLYTRDTVTDARASVNARGKRTRGGQRRAWMCT